MDILLEISRAFVEGFRSVILYLYGEERRLAVFIIQPYFTVFVAGI
jgi:hypothetical protein